MILMIDGYNLIKQVETTALISAELRASFIVRLAQYAQAKRLNLLLIFDGGERGQISELGIQVIYAGERETADDVIRKLLQQFRRRGLQDHVLLITSDRELQRQAQTAHATSLATLKFYELLLRFERRPAAVSSNSVPLDYMIYSSNATELDTIMLAGSQQLPADKLTGTALPNANKQSKIRSQASKQTRKLKKKLTRL